MKFWSLQEKTSEKSRTTGRT